MTKKYPALALLLIFLSCMMYNYTTIPVQNAQPAEVLDPVDDRIIGVSTIDNRSYEFTYNAPALLDSGFFCGKSVLNEKVKIPAKDVTQVRIKRFDGVSTFVVSSLAVVGGTAVVLGVAMAIIIATKECCPFIYSYDGQGYQFDAEPYGGAICEGLARSEWCELEHLKEVNGLYKIKIANEVDETQYTDELKLVTVDHPTGYSVVVDISGNFHSCKIPQAPIAAFTGEGKDILPQVAKNDYIFWHSMDNDLNKEGKRPLRTDITLVFAKPKGARHAKLIVNGSNTLWGSQMLKRYLALGGDRIDSWYKKINGIAASGQKPDLWTTRAQLYELKAFALAGKVWEQKTVIRGGGPFISEDRCYPIDVSDIPGDSLKIKFSVAENFWQFNSFAIDYSEDLPVTVTQIPASKAVVNNGRDVLGLFATIDKKYQTMPEKGNYAEVEFPAPVIEPGQVRTVFVKATGYYDIHLPKKGLPDIAKLHRLERDPDYAVEYSAQEFRAWEKSLPTWAAK
jgi:hypothetical protein